MKELDYLNRWAPCFEGALYECIDRLSYTPYTTNNPEHGRTPGWLHFGTLALLRGDDRGWFHAHMTEELGRMIQRRSIFDASPAVAYLDHHLELRADANGLYLAVGFAKVSGIYTLISVDERELHRLLDAAKAVGEVPVQERPSAEQRAAVRRFAERAGPQWKTKLHMSWMMAAYPDSPEADRPLLQQVRNQYGPAWLETVTLEALED